MYLKIKMIYLMIKLIYLRRKGEMDQKEVAHLMIAKTMMNTRKPAAATER